jgi:hypothetical protein
VATFGRVPWTDEAEGWVRTVVHAWVAALVAAAYTALAAFGRDAGIGLAGECLVAGWLAWAAVAVAWPWRAPAATARRVGAAFVAGLAALALAFGLLLLAVPIVAAGGFAGSSRSTT